MRRAGRTRRAAFISAIPIRRNIFIGIMRRFREGFAKLGELGLSFDAWLYHPQFGDLIDLAQSFPEQPIVLNHVGGPLGLEWYADRKDEVFAEWRASIEALSACDNVTIKIGGMGMKLNGFGFEAHDKAPSSDALAAAWRPFVETCIEAFGVRRCMFESNFPVDKISGHYGNYWNAFKKLAAGRICGRKGVLVQRDGQAILSALNGRRALRFSQHARNNGDDFRYILFSKALS